MTFKIISFVVENVKLLKKYNEIWSEFKEKYEKKKSDSDPIFNDKRLRTKIKSYNKKITTDFKNGKDNSTKPFKEGSGAFVCLQ